jgi:enoyl-CoA hydratase/carnithine racemase
VQLNDILYEKNEGVAVATFNRPDSLNAFRQATFQELREVIQDVRTDDAVRVLVLTGRGRAFSAGIDLKETAHLSGDAVPLRPARDLLLMLQDITRCLANHPKIIIAAVNGIAVGVGAELSIASDIRIAAETATFAFAEVRRGLFETNGVMYYLPRLVGLGRAMEMLLTGDKISASEALEAGLVTHVVRQDHLVEFAVNVARTIAANAPISVRLVKQVMRRTYDLDLEAVMQLEVDGMLECLASEDLQEGIQAFIEKRTPVYSGK